ncbi:hypothetical protein TYRP_012361 [Tyrophagus putrescentiae]|nr:hypothetical protein TYRP_012361 [Tyrophagus putrescentiae]
MAAQRSVPRLLKHLFFFTFTLNYFTYFNLDDHCKAIITPTFFFFITPFTPFYYDLYHYHCCCSFLINYHYHYHHPHPHYHYHYHSLHSITLKYINNTTCTSFNHHFTTSNSNNNNNNC